MKAIESGANGILPKNTIREELIEAINAVYSGKEFISKYIPYSTFVNGETNKQIAEKLFISQRTAEKHKSNILNKLDMNSLVDLVKFAIKNKIVEL